MSEIIKTESDDMMSKFHKTDNILNDVQSIVENSTSDFHGHITELYTSSS